MSGYSAVAVDKASRPGLECPHCRHFLREAVQTEEGLRLCKSCFKAIQRLVAMIVNTGLRSFCFQNRVCVMLRYISSYIMMSWSLQVES